MMVLQEDTAAVQRTFAQTDVRYLVKPFHVQEALALVSAPLPGAAAPLEQGY
jgi:hypothetical protein